MSDDHENDDVGHSDVDRPDESDDEVGYGKPPKKHRIKKGEVRNPRGRPRKATDIASLINIELDRTIRMKEGGREILIRKRDALAKRLVNSALNGNTRSIEYLVQYCEKHGAGDPFEITPADRVAFEIEMKRRARSDLANRRPETNAVDGEAEFSEAEGGE